MERTGRLLTAPESETDRSKAVECDALQQERTDSSGVVMRRLWILH
jgi:hypothetical protein